jgi:hypothetical protein
MNTRIAAFCAAVAATGLAAQASALIHLGTYNGHDYYVSETTMDVFSARALAAATGASMSRPAYLAAINDAAEQAWLTTATSQWGLVWIGLSDEDVEGVWKWDSGEPFTFANWAPGEPNNFGEEDYVHMNWAGPGLWNDIYPTFQNRALIEVGRSGGSGSAIPGPAAAVMFVAGLAQARRRK